jgi:hypothetical protein
MAVSHKCRPLSRGPDIGLCMSRRSRTPYDTRNTHITPQKRSRNLRCPKLPLFRTIDFLTLLDLCHIPDRVRARFF